jgi:hypothetical protein
MGNEGMDGVGEQINWTLVFSLKISCEVLACIMKQLIGFA